MANFLQRPRRLRYNPVLRDMIKNHHVRPENLVMPLFVKEGLKTKKAIASMPGQFQFSVKEIVAEARECQKRGIKSVILFGIPQKKDERGSQAGSDDGIVQTAIKAIKDKCPDLFVISDVCLCEYTSHGHCGIISENGFVENDMSLEVLARVAMSHAAAGADMVAPSDMMDGRVGLIRKTLDSTGYNHIPIMSYAVKYASSFYGPFRDAGESAPQFGDRKSYQMDFASSHDAVREAKLDVAEGADIIMVKPAMSYLDVLQQLKTEIDAPLAAYQVSGEYAMICAAAEKGWLDKKAVVLESLTAIKRAGAQIIVTYFAKEFISGG